MPNPSKPPAALLAALTLNRGELDPAKLAAVLARLAQTAR